MAANMRALGAVLAVSGVAVVLAVLLITQSDLHGESVLAQKPKHVMAKPMVRPFSCCADMGLLWNKREMELVPCASFVFVSRF